MTLLGPESEFGQIILQYITNPTQLSIEDRRLIRQLIVDKTPPEERNHFISLVNIPRTSTASAIAPPVDTSFFRTNPFVFGGTPSLILERIRPPPPPPPPLPQSPRSNNKSVENVENDNHPKSEH
jgi:hypothetical protein